MGTKSFVIRDVGFVISFGLQITNHESLITNAVGGPPGDRTRDTLIKSQVLYH
jgi:hypothetical protein